MCRINSFQSSTTLFVASWNVNGVRTCKLDNPKFSSKLCSDIIILNDTHAGSNGILNLDCYYCVSNCMSTKPNRLRGGVDVFIKNNLNRGVKIVDKSHTDIVWLKLQKSFFFNFEQDLYICGIYISPSSSSYMKRTDVDKNIFHKLDSDVIRFSRVGKVMIMGDLNANINNKEHG